MNYYITIPIVITALVVFAILWRLLQVDKATLARNKLLYDIATLAKRHHVELRRFDEPDSCTSKCYLVTIKDIPFSLLIYSSDDGKAFSDVLKFKSDNPTFYISWGVKFPELMRGITKAQSCCDNSDGKVSARKCSRIKKRNYRKLRNERQRIANPHYHTTHIHIDDDRSYNHDAYRDSDARTGHNDIVTNIATTAVGTAAGVVVGNAINNDLEEMFGGGDRYSNMSQDDTPTITEVPHYEAPTFEPTYSESTPSTSWGGDSGSYDSGNSGDSDD